ncbi:hypothetical protein [Aggregatibacter kilianii]|uniref:hypothetical protein n=1 Tax=Aggregatibacter kilianii TaxID=2025884 RepID=UPI000D65AB91|nr:hypothetical protein [Aggregatibacter kilianii]
MLLRIPFYFFLTLGLLYLVLTWWQRKEGKFIESLRTFIFMGGLAIVFLVVMNLGTKEEQYRNYQIYENLIRERRLTARELEMLHGIENIPSNAKLILTYDDATLVAPKGQFFTWGPFPLKKMELDHFSMELSANDLFGDKEKYFNVHGVNCQLRNYIKLKRKNQTSGYNFDDFRVDYCYTKDIKFHLENQFIDSESTYLSFFPTLKDFLDDSWFNNIPKAYLPSEQPSVTMSLSPYSALALLVGEKQNIFRVYDIAADMNGQIFALYGGIKIPVTKETMTEKEQPKYQIGNCRYFADSRIYGINFKDGWADWYFMPPRDSSDKAEPLSDECKIQRLPYVITSIER